jgi:hypothetical protein
MRIASITISNDRNGSRAYALVTMQSNHEALAFLGEGEQTIDAQGSALRVKPIAPGATPGSVCCRIIDQY